jgi:hypothetical protein
MRIQIPIHFTNVENTSRFYAFGYSQQIAIQYQVLQIYENRSIRCRLNLPFINAKPIHVKFCWSIILTELLEEAFIWWLMNEYQSGQGEKKVSFRQSILQWPHLTPFSHWFSKTPVMNFSTRAGWEPLDVYGWTPTRIKMGILSKRSSVVRFMHSLFTSHSPILGNTGIALQSDDGVCMETK